MVEYFKELEEESIRDNFVVIYELLDELLDFGYPQTTDSKILQEYITQEGHKLEIQPRIPMAVTNAVSWRSIIGVGNYKRHVLQKNIGDGRENKYQRYRNITFTRIPACSSSSK